jgi:aminoglycoside phosphotransferase (APT) family kinase protein
VSVRIDEALVRQLLAEQLPEWAALPIRPVDAQGHDNRTFRLGDALAVRLPTAERYAAHVAVEHAWLPRLAPQLPLPIPRPVARGAPGCGFPWPWSVSRWLPGDSALRAPIADAPRFARDVAGFLTALRAIDARGAPPPGPDNFFRGGDLSVYAAETERCLAAAPTGVDAHAARALWAAACETRWNAAPVWVHGDVAAGNLLVSGGALCGVIDFGQLAAGDPACDTVLAWTFFSGDGRAAFREALDLDAATWLRGRAWALWKALLSLAAPDPAPALRVIAAVLGEERSGDR